MELLIKFLVICIVKFSFLNDAQHEIRTTYFWFHSHMSLHILRLLDIVHAFIINYII